MYVYEEMVNGRKLSEIINTDHENPKYMPGVKLPENVVCLFYVLDTYSLLGSFPFLFLIFSQTVV